MARAILDCAGLGQNFGLELRGHSKFRVRKKTGSIGIIPRWNSKGPRSILRIQPVRIGGKAGAEIRQERG